MLDITAPHSTSCTDVPPFTDKEPELREVTSVAPNTDPTPKQDLAKYTFKIPVESAPPLPPNLSCPPLSLTWTMQIRQMMFVNVIF